MAGTQARRWGWLAPCVCSLSRRGAYVGARPGLLVQIPGRSTACPSCRADYSPLAMLGPNPGRTPVLVHNSNNSDGCEFLFKPNAIVRVTGYSAKRIKEAIHRVKAKVAGEASGGTRILICSSIPRLVKYTLGGLTELLTTASVTFSTTCRRSDGRGVGRSLDPWAAW